jgi:hypothetical protein
MISENEVLQKMDETVNRLTKFREDFAKDPRPPQAGKFIELALVSRIKTLQEVLGIGSWDEKQISSELKLDSSRWAMGRTQAIRR